jgi:hypothetical protein
MPPAAGPRQRGLRCLPFPVGTPLCETTPFSILSSRCSVRVQVRRARFGRANGQRPGARSHVESAAHGHRTRQRLGPYVTALIGEGGMGCLCRRDSRVGTSYRDARQVRVLWSG